jgi:CubicO group peptidase (beta-lactamase class C family)
MRQVLARIAGLTLLGGLLFLNLDYWRDPPYWRRWWDTVSHLEPDYMNLQPLEDVAASRRARLPLATEPQRSIEPEALRAGERYAAQFDSFALIVVHRGLVQTEWYRPGWQADRLTQSQSMHKTVAALMIGAAIEDGYIASLDDPVGRYLPEWADDARGRMSIRNLLNMSSGLGRYEFTLNPFARSSAFRFLFSAERDAIVLATPLEWEPGSRFDYNDVNAQIAGMIVERTSGRRYAEYLSARLWDPMGGPPAKVWLDRESGRAMTACCLLAPAMAWARLGVALKDRGVIDGRQVVPADWIETMIAPSSNNAGYGLFTWIGAGISDEALPTSAEISQSEPFAAADIFMLLGHGGQRVYVSRALDLVVVRLGPFNGYQPLKAGWDNARLFNIIARGILPK